MVLGYLAGAPRRVPGHDRGELQHEVVVKLSFNSTSSNKRSAQSQQLPYTQHLTHAFTACGGEGLNPHASST